MQESVNKEREKYIGGSDIPVIMNLSPFKSRFDLLLEKAGYKDNDFTGNVFTDYGNALEPKIRDHINSLREITSSEPFVEGKHIREAEGSEIIGVRIHTDGENNNSILEIKTTSQVHDNVEDYKLYLVQLLFYMATEGKSSGMLAVYERPEDLNETFEPERLQIFSVSSDDYEELIADIEQSVESFIVDLQKVKDNPFITEEELLPTDITDITKRILAFESQLQYMKDTEAKIKEDKARLKAAMEAANVKSWKTPNGYTITLVNDTPPKVIKEPYLDTEALVADKPEIIKEYTKIKEVIKNGRTGYVKITAPKNKEG